MHGGRPVVTSTFCRSVSSDEQFRVVALGNKLSKCSHRRASSLHQQLRPAGSRHSTPESAKEPPLNTYKPKGPYTATIVSVEQAVAHNALGETCHVVIDHAGNVTYCEGHSYEIIPRGLRVLLGLHANDVGCRAVLGRRHHDEGMNKLVHAWFWQYHRKICL